jgi:hypothetical protein
MKLMIEDEGGVRLQDGKPVYVDDEGKEIAFDAPAAMSKIRALNNEAKEHRLKAEDYKTKAQTYSEQLQELTSKIDQYADLDPRKAKRALEKVAKLDAGELLEMEKVEMIKQQLRDEYEDQTAQLKTGFEGKEKQYQQELEKYTQTLTQKEQFIYNLLVSNQFATLPFISQQTTMTPDVAATMFGKYFKVETDDTGNTQLVAYLNGEKILSRTRHGEPASFDEAFKVIWDAYPNKEAYTKTTSGSGSSGGIQSNTAANDSPGWDRLYETMD